MMGLVVMDKMSFHAVRAYYTTLSTISPLIDWLDRVLRHIGNISAM